MLKDHRHPILFGEVRSEIRSLQRPGEYLSSAAYLVRTFGSRNWAPSPDHWKDYFRARFVGLRTEEYEAIKEWLLFMSNIETYRKYINRKPGLGDIFERAIETVCLARRESLRGGDGLHWPKP